MKPGAEVKWGGQRFLWILAGITAAGCILRFAEIGRQPLWLDEATDAAFAARPFWDCVFAEFVHPPLYRMALHFFVAGFGDSDAALRFLPAVFGSLTVPIAAPLARRILPGTELPAAAMLASSPFLVFFSQENRNYSLFILLTLLSTFLLLRYLDGGKGLAWYTLACVLLLYTHYLSLLVLLAHEAVYWNSDSKRGQATWFAARLACTAAFAPWFFWVATQYHDESRLFLSPFWLIPVFLLRVLLGYGVAVFDAGWQEEALLSRLMQELPMIAATLAISSWLLWLGWRNTHARRTLFVAILLIPWSVLLVASPWIKLSSERYLAFQAPFILMLIAAGVCVLCGRRRVEALIVLLVINSFALAAYYGGPGSLLGYPLRYGKENWAGAATFIRQHNVDTVIVAPGYLNLPLRRYDLLPAKTIEIANASFSPDLAGSRIALVAGRMKHHPEQYPSLKGALASRYHLVAKARFPSQNMIIVEIYERERVIPQSAARRSPP